MQSLKNNSLQGTLVNNWLLRPPTGTRWRIYLNRQPLFMLPGFYCIGITGNRSFLAGERWKLDFKKNTDGWKSARWPCHGILGYTNPFLKKNKICSGWLPGSGVPLFNIKINFYVNRWLTFFYLKPWKFRYASAGSSYFLISKPHRQHTRLLFVNFTRLTECRF